MEKTLEQLKQERSLLWITLSNCHTALRMANEVYLPDHVKRFVQMGINEAQYALDATTSKEEDEPVTD